MHLPPPQVARKAGWTHQVEWIEEGKPCFIRRKSAEAAERTADELRAQFLEPTVTPIPWDNA